MKKNNLRFCLLIALFFISNYNPVFAEEIQTFSELPATTTEQENIDQENSIHSTSTEESTEEISDKVSLMELTPDISNLLTVNLNIRYKDSVIFSGPISLIKDATTTILDNTNITREIISSTALGALNQADFESINFNISDLVYYPSWNSFLINCLDVVNTSSSLEKACYSWQYVVNDKYPSVGSDQYTLNDGDSVYFYFGEPRILEFSTTTISTGSPLNITAKNYDYQNNLYVPLSNYVVGVTQTDPNNPWTPIVLFSTTTDSFGQANFIINATGSYILGYEVDYYYHFPPYVLEVTESNLSTTTATATTTSDNQTGGSTYSSNININKAIEFLVSRQFGNGSFGSDLYTHWGAIGLVASGNSSAKSLIKNYLISKNISSKILTDIERHTLALMTLGVNPYTGTEINYISKILAQFDGQQFGESDLLNDDIFALLTLLNAGYFSSDDEISKTVDYVIDQQNLAGDWGGVDLTAAAIQSLVLVQDLPKVNLALEKAKSYLKSKQVNDAGFTDGFSSDSNVFSTAWVLQALVALGEGQSNWMKNGKTIEEYLASKQDDDDGGLVSELDEESRIWATSYLIPAYKGKTWNDLMTKFKKPKIISNSNSSNNEEVLDEVEIENNLELESEDNALIFEFGGEEMDNDNLPILKKDNLLKNDLESQDVASLPEIQANVLGSVDNSGLFKTMNSFLGTTLVGLSTMWGFVVSLFKF